VGTSHTPDFSNRKSVSLLESNILTIMNRDKKYVQVQCTYGDMFISNS